MGAGYLHRFYWIDIYITNSDSIDDLASLRQ